MPDSKLLERSGERIFTAAGALASGAKLYVYDAGTTDLQSIYTDSDLTVASSNPVTCDANGLCPYIYVGTNPYKLRIETSAGVLIDEEDDIPGATDTGTLSAAFAKSEAPFVVKTSNYTVTTADLGSIINANCTGGTFTLTLPNAIDATNGRGIIVRHTGTSNQVRLVTTSSETITGPFTGVTTTAFSLTGYGESVTLVSDAAGWHMSTYVPPLIRNSAPIVVADRITSAPGSPVAGARYLVTVGFSTFETHDIIEYTGQTGVYIEYTPAADCGWLAYVQDEDSTYQFQGSAWVELGADKAAMEAASAVGRYSTPGTQQHHPGHPKAWGYITNSGGTPSNTASYGVSSISDAGVGSTGITLTTSMSSANYPAVGSFLGSPSGFLAASVFCLNIGTGGFTLGTYTATASGNTALTATDMSAGFIAMGDQ